MQLELAAQLLALAFWDRFLSNNLVTWFGDNDSARFALIRAASSGRWAEALLCHHLNSEVDSNTKA